MSRRAQELAEQGVAFVTATVVRAQRPTSAEAGNVALVLGDGTVEGFVGGVCAEQSVRAYSLEAMRGGEAVLLRILPLEEGAAPEDPEAEAGGAEVAREDGAVTVHNPCLSGGAIEVFLEPTLRAPRVLVEGDTPIARAILRIGPELGLEVAGVGKSFELRPDDLALVAAGHGRDELEALRRGLDAGLPYVGLVASSRRGRAVIGELREQGLPEAILERVDTPAGLDIGARTPAEIALSILARIVSVRRGGERPVPVAAASAVDPICGMAVAAVAGTPSLVHEGESVFFCSEGCRAEFQRQHEHAVAE